MSPPTSSLHPGLPIGGYELVYPLGKGGMAEVWLARRQASLASRHVAIKVIADHHVGDPAYRRMFHAEAGLSGLLCHANIVQVFQEGEEHGRSFLVMEWVDGVSLVRVRSALAVLGAAQRERIAAYVVGQLLHALAYAHSVTTADGNSLGIVHRDVSPQNVLVSNQGEVKLTDFGVAHHVLEESSGLHVKGKLRYMSPEQLAGATRAPTVDLYAVGAILHELLAGELFRAEARDEPHMLGLVLRGVIPTLPHVIPHELDALRRGLLEPDPQKRIQTADAALEQLARYPDYRDARRELMRVCRALTGVDRPRSGPMEPTMPNATPMRSPSTFDAPASDAPVHARRCVPTEQLPAPSATRKPIATPSRSPAEVTEVGFPAALGITTTSPARRDALPARERLHPILRGLLAASMLVLVLGGGAITLILNPRQRAPEAAARVDGDVRQQSASSEDQPRQRHDTNVQTKPAAATGSSRREGVGSSAREAKTTPLVLSSTTDPHEGLSVPGVTSVAVSPEVPTGSTANPSTARLDEELSQPAVASARGASEAPPPPAPHSTPACASARTGAHDAAARWDWAAVIAATERTECWRRSAREEWRGLRIKALAETGRFEACARLGRTATSDAVLRQARICQERVK